MVTKIHISVMPSNIFRINSFVWYRFPFKRLTMRIYAHTTSFNGRRRPWTSECLTQKNVFRVYLRINAPVPLYEWGCHAVEVPVMVAISVSMYQMDRGICHNMWSRFNPRIAILPWEAAWMKWPTYYRRHFQMHSFRRIFAHFDLNFTSFFPRCTIDKPLPESLLTQICDAIWHHWDIKVNISSAYMRHKSGKLSQEGHIYVLIRKYTNIFIFWLHDYDNDDLYICFWSLCFDFH